MINANTGMQFERDLRCSVSIYCVSIFVCLVTASCAMHLNQLVASSHHFGVFIIYVFKSIEYGATPCPALHMPGYL